MGPAGAEDRLAAASEIVDLARAAGDGARERDGMFWRFVALMELARVAEAESALAAFHRAAAAAGDVKAVVMATARQAMLANLRGRFDQATELIAEVAAEGPRAGLPDTYRVVGSVWGEITFYRGPRRRLRTCLIRCRIWRVGCPGTSWRQASRSGWC